MLFVVGWKFMWVAFVYWGIELNWWFVLCYLVKEWNVPLTYILCILMKIVSALIIIIIIVVDLLLKHIP